MRQREGGLDGEDWIWKHGSRFITAPHDSNRNQPRQFGESRIMLACLKTELRRNIATIERNVKVSGEYKNNFIRIFLTLEEARKLLDLIEKYNLREAS